MSRPVYPVYSMRVAILLASLVGATSIAEAQTTGTIDGVIRDTSGAALPSVQVVANSPALIQKDLTTYSNQEGFYRLPLLPPGIYTVTYVLQGFQTVERVGLIVNAGQATSVDLELKLATVEESVTVVGESPTVDRASAKLGFSYTTSLIENIPTTRDFAGLVRTTPGVEGTRSQNVMGAGVMANASTFDGANTTDPRTQVNQMYLLSYDIMEEVQVLRGGKPAEVGFAQGGFFQVVTKSGGNDFHGVGNVYYQEDGLQSNNFTDRLRQAGFTTSDRLIDDIDGSVSGGWRFIRDKLWWFGSARRQEATRELLGFPEDNDETTDGYFWKNTYQPHARHRFTGGFSYWAQWVALTGPSPSLAADRNGFFERDFTGKLAYTRWNGVLSDNIVVEGGGGFSRVQINLYEQKTAGVAVRDLVTGMRFRNVARLPGGIFSRDNPSYNYDVGGALSWFVSNAAGRHLFKFGAQYTRVSIPGYFTQKGDHVLSLAAGRPSQVTLLTTPAEVGIDQNLPSLYAQDSWTIGNQLTLNLGVRYDHIDAFTADSVMGGGAFANTPLADRVPELNRRTIPGRSLMKWNSFVPRLAASWAVDGRTTIKGSFSRYYHFMQTTLLPGTGVLEVQQFTFQWNDRNGDREYQAGEEGQLLLRTGGGGRATEIDPNIRQSYTDEVVAGISRELFADFSIHANFIYRRDTDLINVLNVGVPFSAYTPVQIADLGPDGRVGTGDDGTLIVFAQDRATLGQDRNLLTNPNHHGFNNDRTYKAFEVVANKRLSNRWQFVGSFLVSKMDVLQTTQQSIWPRYQNPNVLVNARGRDPGNDTYVVKLQGTYQAPYGIGLSSFYRFGSGLPFTRELVVRGLPQGVVTVFAEPRGSRENDNSGILDFRAEKTVDLGKDTRLGLILDVFNLTNSSAVLAQGSRTGVDLGVPRLVQTPRVARLGVRFMW